MKVLGVYREKVFSPGKIADDAAILDRTLTQLSRMGYEFSAIEAEKLTADRIGTRFILTMAQSTEALKVLEAQEEDDAVVINSVASVRGSYRKPLLRCLSDAGLPLPWSDVLATKEAGDGLSFRSGDCFWLKRGDVHAMEAGDVVKVRSSAELAQAIRHFTTRKIESLLVQEHVEGEVIKFYGAGEASYYSAFRASNGEEVTSGTGELRLIARKAAEAVGLDVYGGDAIVTKKGEIRLIDLNDWPSFSRCSHAAAIGIADHIARLLRRH